jgi:endonuclease YncB( thermonuclease family)
MKILKNSLFALIAFFTFSFANAQGKAKSPAEKVTGVINGATIEINYGSPSVKGRKIWGELVPYGEVWRAGANDATTFETSKEITIEGLRLPAGKYSFFVIPKENECVVIFNKEAKQWGAYKYKEKDDQLRVTVKQQMADSTTEKLTYIINAVDVELVWENWIIGFSVK